MIRGKEDAIKTNSPAWSEEDEKNIEKIDGFLTEVFCYGHVYVSQKDKEELQCWLKSFKERYTWKPSYEQMEYLAKAITTLGNEGDNKTSAILCELRTDLKNLKG